MPRVNIPGVGFVNFPDTMTPDEISAVIRKNYKPQQAAPTPQPQAAAPQPNIAQQAQQNLARIKAGQDIPADSVRPARAASAGELGAAGGIGVGVGALEGVPSLAAMGADATFDTLTAGPVRRAVKSVVPGAPVLLPWENADDPSMPLTQAVASLGDRAQRGLKSAVGLDGIATDATDALSRDILSAPIEPWAAVKGLRKVLQKGAAGTVKEAATNVAPKLADEAIDATDAAVQAARAQSPAPVTETITADVEVPPAPAPYSFRYSTDPNDLNQRTFYHGSGTANLRPEALDPTATKIEGLYSQGIYLTDNPDIAKGYATARRNAKSPTLYEAGVNVGKVLDLEAPITPDVAQIMEARARQLLDDEPEYLAPVLQKLRGGTSGDVMEELGKQVELYSKGNMIPISEFYDGFGLLSEELKHAGYDALTHVGGKKTGRNPHQVLILLDPNDRYAQTGRSGQVTRFEPSSLNGSHGAPPPRRPLKDVWAEFQQAEREANEAFGNISKVDAALADAMTPTEAKRAPIAMTIDPATGRGVPKKYNIIPQAEQRRMMAEARAAADAAMARRNALQKELDEVAQAEDAAQKAVPVTETPSRVDVDVTYEPETADEFMRRFEDAFPVEVDPATVKPIRGDILPDGSVQVDPSTIKKGKARGAVEVLPDGSLEVDPSTVKKVPEGPLPEQKKTGFLKAHLTPILNRYEQMGPVGQTVARTEHAINSTARELAARPIGDVRSVLKKLSKEEAEQYVAVMNGEAVPTSPNVQEAVRKMRLHFDRFGDEAIAQKVMVQASEDTGTWNPAMRDYFKPFEKRENYIMKVFDRDPNGGWKVKDHENLGTFTSSLQKERTGVARDLTPDELIAAHTSYFKNASRTLAEARHIRNGAEYFPGQTFKQWANGMVDAAARSVDKTGKAEDAEYLAKTLPFLHGKSWGDDLLESEKNVLSKVRNFETITKLTKAVIANAGQSFFTMARGGMTRSAWALKDLTLNAAKRKDVLASFADAGGHVDSMAKELSSGDGLLGKFAKFELKITGFSPVETGNRLFGFAVGRMYVDDLVKAVSGTETALGRVRRGAMSTAYARKDLARLLNVAPDQLDDVVKRGIPKEVLDRAAFNFTERVQLPTSEGSLPVTWIRGPYEVTRKQFKGFTLKYFHAVKEDIVKAAAQGNAGPLVRLVPLAAAFGYPIAKVKSFISGKSAEENEDPTVVDKIADTFSVVFMLDMMGRIYHDAKRGNTTRAIGAPYEGDIEAIGQAAYYTAEDASEILAGDKFIDDVAEEIGEGKRQGRAAQSVVPLLRDVYNHMNR
jgi:hypothetical protein